MSGVLCLRWNNHTSTFIKTLDNLREKELYCDATIACNGKYFPVHRFVLTTCSEYFEDIFERTQCRHPIIIIKDIEEINIEALLKYMYNGEVNVLQDRLPGLIRAAEALKIRGLAVSEDQPEVKKPQKEKRKSNQTSPLQSKSKKNLNKSQSIATECVDILEDETNDSVTNGTESPFPSINDVDMEQEKEDSGPPPSNAEDSNSNEKENAQEIKSEQSDMFEAVEEDFPVNQPSTEETNNASDNEQSLFVSLLSPNNAHGSEDDSNQMVDNADNSAIPQCSSWTDDTTASNQERVDDEIAGKNQQWLKNEDFEKFIDLYSSNSSKKSLENDFQNQRNAMFEPSQIFPEIYNSSSSKILPDVGATNVSHISSADILKHLVSSAKEESETAAVSVDPLSRIALPDLSTNYAALFSDNLESFESQDLEESTDNSDPAVKTKRYSCTLCNLKCKDTSALKLHIMRRHTGEKPFSCSFCSYRCTTKGMLKIHTRKHTGERPFPCPYCSVRMSVKSSLKRHILLKHIEAMDVKPLVTFSEGSGGSPSLMFPTKKKSTKSLHSGKHQCPMCSFETKTKAELLRHVSYSHSDFRFSCAICNYKCRTNSLLKKHMLKHTLEKPFLCSLCPYKTARKQHLVRHMKLHTGEKPYSCFLCSYKASRKDRLREHIRKHDQYFENSLVAHNLFASSVGVSSNLDPQEIFQTEPNRGN